MSLPPELLEAFDKASEHSGYRDRSKALQAAMRSFISDFETGVRGGHVVGSIVMVYNHETHGADEGITETSHHHRQSILSSLDANKANLKLVETKTFGSGVVLLRYQPNEE